MATATVRRGDVFQFGNDLVYVTTVCPEQGKGVVLLDGYPQAADLSVLTPDHYRGNVTEADLMKMLRKLIG